MSAGGSTATPAVPAAYLAVVVLWSTTPLAINWSLPLGGYAFSLLARIVVGLACALLLLYASGGRLPLRRAVWPAYLIGGGSLFVTFYCVYWGAQYIYSGLIALVFGLSPLVTGMVAAVWLGERAFSPIKLAGMLLSIAGLAIVFAGGGNLGSPQALTGLAVVLLAVGVNAFGLVGMKRLGGAASPLAATAGTLLVSLPLCVLSWFLSGGALPEHYALRPSLAVVYLGLFSSVVGFALYYFLMKHLPAVSLAMITVVTPLVALVLGSLLNDEALSVRTWAGAALVCAGLYLNIIVPARQARRQAMRAAS